MRYRQLGDLPVLVSEIGIGTAQLSNTDGNFPGTNHIPIDEAKTIIKQAIDSGVTFFDTAPSYGNTELLLGELSSDTKSKVTIATKAGLRKDRTGQISRDFSESYLTRQVDQSLTRLRVDCLDLFQLNKPTHTDLADGRLFELLNIFRDSGKIRHAGIVIGSSEAALACLRSDSVDCVQILYNLLFPEHIAIIKEAGRRGKGVIVRSPLNSGVLAGCYTPNTMFSSNDERSTFFSGKRFLDRLDRLESIQQQIPVSNQDLLHFSLQYILSCNDISCVIPGASSVDQVLDYCVVGDEPLLPARELDRATNVVLRCLQGFEQQFQI